MFEFDYANEFIVIRYLPVSKGLYVYWVPGNQCMSMLDFYRAIEVILNTITVTQPSKVLINAIDYSFPILPEKTTRLIRYTLSSSPLKQYGLIKSNQFYGQFAIKLLLKRLANAPIDLILFDQPMEGIRWVLSK